MNNDDWREFIQGNNHSLSRLYEPYFQPLLFVALKYVRNTEIAQDITSELFLSLLETDVRTRNEKWGEIKNVKAFLSTIINCRAIDYIKIEQNRKHIIQNKHLQNQTTNDSINDDLEQLSYCINKLTSEEQKIIKLHLSGYKNQEIAQNQTYTEKTIRNKLSLSRKKLIYLWNNLIFILLWQL